MKNGHLSAIRQLTYQPGVPSSGTVEVLSFDRLRMHSDGHTQRGDFHVLALVDDHRGHVTVDFITHPLGPRTAVWIPPSAVHRWDDIAAVTGTLVLFVPTAPVTHAARQLAASPQDNPVWTVAPDTWAYARAALEHLEFEARAHPTTTSQALHQILLSAFILRLDPPRTARAAVNHTFETFAASVEAQYRTHHNVGHYARTLGYAPRTLSRATQQATGVSAKKYIVDRLVLEAKRLLVHDRLPAARVAVKLGFTDASNFSLFFRTATGTPPATWQQQQPPTAS